MSKQPPKKTWVLGELTVGKIVQRLKIKFALNAWMITTSQDPSVCRDATQRTSSIRARSSFGLLWPFAKQRWWPTQSDPRSQDLKLTCLPGNSLCHSTCSCHCLRLLCRPVLVCQSIWNALPSSDRWRDKPWPPEPGWCWTACCHWDCTVANPPSSSNTSLTYRCQSGLRPKMWDSFHRCSAASECRLGASTCLSRILPSSVPQLHLPVHADVLPRSWKISPKSIPNSQKQRNWAIRIESNMFNAKLFLL